MSSSKKLDDSVYDIGDYVEITQNRRGTIKYEGNIKFVGYIIGLELDETIPGGTDGTLLGVRYFKCPKGKATFVKTNKIKKIIKPKTSKNRIRKALNLPIYDEDNDTNSKRRKMNNKRKSKKKKKKKKSKTKQQSQSAKKSPPKKKKKIMPKIPSLSTNNDDDDSDNSSTGSANSGNSGSSGSKDGDNKASLSSLSKKKSKSKRHDIRKRSDDTVGTPTSSTASPAQPPPRTPRPRGSARRRATSSLKLDKKEREKFMMQHKTKRNKPPGSGSGIHELYIIHNVCEYL